MATIENAGTLALQADSPRVETVALPTNFTIPWGSQITSRPTSVATLNATDGTTLSTAAANATAALADLANIASDGLLTPDEKPRVIQDYNVIIAEQSGIDTQATLYSITTEKTAYDNAVSALTSYLATLTSAVLWSNLAGNTTIVGATFRGKFEDVYTTRQTLLNAIFSASKSLVATAQSTANTAASNASTALATLSDIASDSLLTPGEKPKVILDNAVILAEQAGIDAQASAMAIGSEKTAYDNAVTALTSYLATLTTPVLWSNLSGNTTIVGATFKSKFEDVYTTKQALLNAIAAKAATLATWSEVSGAGKPADNATVGAVLSGLYANITGALETLHIADSAVTAAKTSLAAINSTTGNLNANTVTASNIVAGTITGTEIAASTISASHLTVSNLAAITANLGTVTAGSLTAASSMNTNGYVHAYGNLLTGLNYAGSLASVSGYFETVGASNASYWDVAVTGWVTGTNTAHGKIGVLGIADQTNGVGVSGQSAAGYAVVGESTSGVGGRFVSSTSYALVLVGPMSISSTSLVSNLNADTVDGVHAAGFVKCDSTTIYQYSLDSGTTWVDVIFRVKP